MASEQSGRGRRLCVPRMPCSALLHAETIAPRQVIVRLGQQPRRRCCGGDPARGDEGDCALRSA
eukprot:6443526-Prymnesium_polylepis.1